MANYPMDYRDRVWFGGGGLEDGDSDVERGFSARGFGRGYGGRSLPRREVEGRRPAGYGYDRGYGGPARRPPRGGYDPGWRSGLAAGGRSFMGSNRGVYRSAGPSGSARYPQPRGGGYDRNLYPDNRGGLGGRWGMGQRGGRYDQGWR